MYWVLAAILVLIASGVFALVLSALSLRRATLPPHPRPLPQGGEGEEAPRQSSSFSLSGPLHEPRGENCPLTPALSPKGDEGEEAPRQSSSFSLSSFISVAGCVIASVLCFIPVISVLMTGTTESFRHPWAVPYGEFSIGLDVLSAWFLIPILVLSPLAAIHGMEYLASWKGRKSIGAANFLYNILVASIMLVVLSKNAILFLVAWEVMSVASFFLATFEDEKESVRQAGWIYLVAAHLGAAFLFGLFAMMANATHSMDFEVWAKAGVEIAPVAGVIFVMALIGFGAKAGIMPLHVWLPETYPAAPSYVSAIMSGTMSKMGIYGLLRVITWLGMPELWWGYVLIGLGLCSGILGILYAMAQNDLKRLLAYSSVENIGIIVVGMGLGVLGMNLHLQALMALGFGGALLHVLNHSLYKGALFLASGSILQGCGSGDMNRLGGLWKKMPWTGALFLVGAIAISGLPPFNGFLSEFLILLCGFNGSISGNAVAAISGLVALAGIGLISGLAVACFTKAFGAVFLGEPRGDAPINAHEVSSAMRWPIVVLAVACLLVGLSGPFIIPVIAKSVVIITHTPLEESQMIMSRAGSSLLNISLSLGLFIVLAVLLAWARIKLLSGRTIGQTGTWDCGYARPTNRMEYTASSFTQPITDMFKGIVGSRRRYVAPKGLFPDRALFNTHTPDYCHGHLFRPAFERIASWLAQLRWLQHGMVQLYVLYIAITLLALLIWKLM